MIANKDYVIDILERHQSRPIHSYGQNFLIDDHVATKIASALSCTSSDTIIEIGPGLGALSEKLLTANAKLELYDIDPKMIECLHEFFDEHSNVSIYHQDFLKVYPNASQPYQVISNLPYYITTPLIEHVLLHFPVDQFVMMMQAEVEHRLFAKPKQKEYGPLSILIQTISTYERVTYVSASSFYPKPHIDSVVWKLKMKSIELNKASFYKFLQAMFKMRRKTILNNLTSYLSSKTKAEEILNRLQIPLLTRPEEIDISTYQTFYQTVSQER